MTIVRIPDCSLGVVTDQVPEDLPAGAWTDARNVRFKGGLVQTMRGIARIYDATTAVPYYVAPYANGGNVYWVHAGYYLSSLWYVYADNGTSRTDISPTPRPTCSINDRWTGGTLGGVLVMNNGVDRPWYWGGTGVLQYLPGWDATWKAASLRPWRNFLVALDVTKGATRYPHMLKLSDAAVPGAVPSSWDATNPALMALERDLAETPDYCIDAIPLGDALIVYKQRSMYLIRQTFDSNVISSQRLPGDVGMLARGCGAVTPLGHVVLTAGDVVLHAGQGAQSIADDLVRTTIFNGLDPTNYHRAFVCTNPKRSEVWICYPGSSEATCTRAAVWNWSTQKWTFRDLPSVTHGDAGPVVYTAADDYIDNDSGVIDADFSVIDELQTAPNESRLVLANTTWYPYGVLGVVETGTTDLGSSINAYVERKGLHFDAPERVKLLRSVRPRFKGGAGVAVSITVGSAMSAKGDYTEQPAVTFTIGSDDKADVFASGRFFSIKLASSAGAEWALRGLDVDLADGGLY